MTNRLAARFQTVSNALTDRLHDALTDRERGASATETAIIVAILAAAAAFIAAKIFSAVQSHGANIK